MRSKPNASLRAQEWRQKRPMRDDGCAGESQFAGLRAYPGCQALRSKFGMVRAEAEQWPDETDNTRDDHVSSRDAEKRWIISIGYVPRLKIVVNSTSTSLCGHKYHIS